MSRRHDPTTLRTAVTILFFSLCTACAGSTRTVVLPTPTATPPGPHSVPASGATIKIVSPEPSSTIRGPVADVTVKVEGFKLVPLSERDVRPGQGHIVFYSGASFDPPMEADRTATRGGEGGFTAAASIHRQYRWDNVESGMWTFAAQLVSAQGAPLVPPRIAKVIVRVSR